MTPLSPALTKVIAGLSLALLVSLGGNVLLLKTIWVNEGEAKGEKEREALASNNAALEQDAAVVLALSKQARSDNGELLKSLEAIAERGRTDRVVYRTAANKNPLPLECKPGEDRQKAVNKALGPKSD